MVFRLDEGLSGRSATLANFCERDSDYIFVIITLKGVFRRNMVRRALETRNVRRKHRLRTRQL